MSVIQDSFTGSLANMITLSRSFGMVINNNCAPFIGSSKDLHHASLKFVSIQLPRCKNGYMCSLYSIVFQSSKISKILGYLV